MSDLEIMGDTADLLEYERTIEKGLETFVEVGNALIAIRERKLYLLSHETFEDYCKKRWNLSERRAYQFIEAAEVIVELKNFSAQIEPPKVESHAAALAAAPSGKRGEIWAEAVETAPNGKVTAAHVAQTVDRITHPASQRNIGDSEELPPLDELFALYAQIAEKVEHQPTQKYRNQFMVERSAYPSFTLKFLGRGEAWKYWQSKYSRYNHIPVERQMLKPGYPLVRNERQCPDCDHCEDINGEWYCNLFKENYKPSENPAARCERFKDGQAREAYAAAPISETIDRVEIPESESEPVEESPVYQPTPAKRARVTNDYYPTPDVITQALLDRFEIQGTVLEPCAGHGAIAKFFPDCITNEPFPTADFEADFANDATDPVFWEALGNQFDYVVTNPPYESQSLIAILTASLVHARKGVAMLLRLNYLEPCQDRAKLFEDYADCMVHLIPVSPRPQFRKDTTSSDNITVAWFVWNKEWSWSKRGIECPFQFVAGWR